MRKALEGGELEYPEGLLPEREIRAKILIA
jgi:hypothetical protein